MRRTYRFGGPGTAQPAGAATWVIAWVAAVAGVLWTVGLGVFVLAVPLLGPLMVLTVPATLCSVAAVVLLRRDGVASGSLLAAAAPSFVLAAMATVGLTGNWSAGGGAGCGGVAVPLIGALFWERHRERTSIPATVW